MSKNAETDFAKTYAIGIEAMKRRGKSDIGEKTMLDVLIPVCDYLQVAQSKNLSLAETLTEIKDIAIQGMESTREMQATKGRSAFLEARSIGVIDAGAKSCQVIICAIADILLQELPA